MEVSTSRAVWTAVFVILGLSVCGGQDITLQGNGYGGILVAISDCVAEADYPNLVDGIKVSMCVYSLFMNKYMYIWCSVRLGSKRLNKLLISNAYCIYINIFV